jgi:hypothetical protein
MSLLLKIPHLKLSILSVDYALLWLFVFSLTRVVLGVFCVLYVNLFQSLYNVSDSYMLIYPVIWEIKLLSIFYSHSFANMSEWLLFYAKMSIFQLFYDLNKLRFDDDDDVLFVLDQHTELDFYSASSLKQQSAGRHVAPIGYIILIPSQSVFVLTH